MLFRLREPVNGLTHLVGAILSAWGLLELVGVALEAGSVYHLVSFAIYGVSLILLYSASATYHLLPVSEAGLRILRRVDHMMIFVLIAGTYTPFCLVPLRGPWGWSLLVAIWTLAAAGIIMKLFWLHAPRWLSTAFYVGMGWLVMVAIYPLVQALPAEAVYWVAAGGLCYTVGAVFYALKWPVLKPGVFGFHEIWHLFVMAGSFAHFWAIWRYVSYLQ